MRILAIANFPSPDEFSYDDVVLEYVVRRMGAVGTMVGDDDGLSGDDTGIFCWSVISACTTRYREFGADHTGAEISGTPEL
ncbi:MAG: hypothetical protein Ct9H300mP19_10410 [Dehalococcoidia bacterium]|nr:MAG: hypothetical protein Ct9H300mP19_10410 [Dehalococcoidia bacterium]